MLTWQVDERILTMHEQHKHAPPEPVGPGGSRSIKSFFAKEEAEAGGSSSSTTVGLAEEAPPVVLQQCLDVQTLARLLG